MHDNGHIFLYVYTEYALNKILENQLNTYCVVGGKDIFTLKSVDGIIIKTNNGIL